jgi:glutamate synthase (NADPH/NADH) large chain
MTYQYQQGANWQTRPRENRAAANQAPVDRITDNRTTTGSRTEGRRPEASPAFGALPADQIKDTAPLWRPEFEHDNCGTGYVAHVKGHRSHSIITDALMVLNRLAHRGAAGEDPETGDGAGILTQIPDAFFRKVSGFRLPPEGEYAVGQLFLPRNSDDRAACERLIAKVISESGNRLIGFRPVPVNLHACGYGARLSAPWVTQVFIEPSAGMEHPESFDISLYVLRRTIEKVASENGLELYVVSFSSRTIIYKGMMHAWQLSEFYPDLTDPEYASALAMVHSRYSTNTFPSWSRAQPCRYIAHNGEINTLRCVESSTSAAENFLNGGRLGSSVKRILPIIDKDGSDSMKFDNLFEFLTLSGRPMPQVLMMMMPGPWSKDPVMPDEQRLFYKYSACMMPPWDGPAAICFTDGRSIGAVLDRNGLRPLRWALTRDDRMILASEAGVLDVPARDIIRKGKLGPNRMIMLDTGSGRIIEDEELKAIYCKGPWAEWLEKNCIKAEHGQSAEPAAPEKSRLDSMQRLFGWTYEDRMSILMPMAENGLDPVGSMGFDAPLAVLSREYQPLFNYFHQLFAQVTNPPIDSIQEESVTGMDVFIGRSGDFTKDEEENCVKIHLESPILTPGVYSYLREGRHGFKTAEVPMLFTADQGLEKGLEAFFAKAEAAISDGAAILFLTDRDASSELIPIPSLLATAGLHHHLIRLGKRGGCSLVVDSYEPREVHHFACLIGYGAKGIYARGAIEAITDMVRSGLLTGLSAGQAVGNYIHAIDHGILKIMSKMGISCVDGYIRAQIFEAVGLSGELIDKYFTGTVSRLGGLSLPDLEAECLRMHYSAVNDPDKILPSGGRFQWKKNGEEHLYNPETIHLLQTAVRTNNYELYREYKKRVSGETRVTLRSLFGFKEGMSVPIDEVEPVEKIVRRFRTGAMSFGSLSREAHECLAEAMNTLGGMSNSGEGGEDPARFGTIRNSRIKQVASGRFGVTGQYLASADELQIKMAQGAKPGEGGQLPGSKVYPWVARVRNSTPGVGLISPPPHHDIYSIEDLAQLIFDLKNANPEALVSVKLVSETGVGTVAAGVAKGGADIILISGYDGGTGASPRTSIQHAGLPWEIGLAETHQTLMVNGLRGHVRLEVDGKLMTGRDIAIAALLGAERFGFATLPLVALGCVMMRVCNLDTCPVGIATQNPVLRARFSGKPEYVINLMRFLAQDLREIMAELGFRSVDEMVGRAGRLRQEGQSPKTAGLDLSPLISSDMPLPWHTGHSKLDTNRLSDDMVRSLVKMGGAVVTRQVSNVERAVATRIGYFVSKEYGHLPDGHLKFILSGTAGQSFGAFIPSGIELVLEGEANDYLGKGLSGGRIIVKAPADAGWSREDNLLAGNVALFGATGGELFLAGKAGERFCVRNSGATAVCEGVGEHGCEYMTGGTAVILGPVGKNFASGMSGGIAYVLEDERFLKMVNLKLVGLYKLDAMDVVTLYALVKKHTEYTGSRIGREILDDWPKMVHRFVKVLPNDYKEVLEAMDRASADGLSGDELITRAFSIKTGSGGKDHG